MTVGGNLVSLDVPFAMNGQVSHEQILRATMNSIAPLLALPVDADGGPPAADPGAPPGPVPGKRPPHSVYR
jgi:hypothetical protein